MDWFIFLSTQSLLYRHLIDYHLICAIKQELTQKISIMAGLASFSFKKVKNLFFIVKIFFCFKWVRFTLVAKIVIQLNRMNPLPPFLLLTSSFTPTLMYFWQSRSKSWTVGLMLLWPWRGAWTRTLDLSLYLSPLLYFTSIMLPRMSGWVGNMFLCLYKYVHVLWFYPSGWVAGRLTLFYLFVDLSDVCLCGNISLQMHVCIHPKNIQSILLLCHTSTGQFLIITKNLPSIIPFNRMKSSA